MAEIVESPILPGFSNDDSPLSTPEPSKRPHHRHRVFPPPDYVTNLEEKIKTRRKQQQLEHQRHLEAIIAEAATKGSSNSDILNDSNIMKFGEDVKSPSKTIIENTIISDGESKKNVTVVKSKPTLSTSPGFLPLPVPTQPAVRTIDSEEKANNGGKDNNGEFGEIVSAVWSKVKSYVGFTPECLNGGTKKLGGKCYCPQYFSGDYCSEHLCLNNSTLVRISTIPMEEKCQCNSIYISGRHCETVLCQNGGRPIIANGSTHCKCVDGWYTGQFCEYYAASWFAVLGIPLICIAVIALCCVICRLDFCPKRTMPANPHREHRRRNRGPQEARRLHRPHYDHSDPQRLIIHENLLNDCHHHFRRPPSTSHSSGQIVRLENIPVYNPSIPHLPTDEYKPLEPPPSYEQAVASCPSITTPLPTTRAQPPPIYSPPQPSVSQTAASYGSSRPPEDIFPPN